MFGEQSLIERIISPGDNVSAIIISVALMLFLGFAMTRLTKLLRLPNVTAYIIVGILIGPFVFNLIPKNVLTGMDFLPDIALAFIAFSTGEFFKIDVIKKKGGKVLIITIFEALLASILVFILTYFILKIKSLPFCIVLASLASATAPASTLMTIRQTKAKGDFVNTLLQVVAIDDIVALLAYSIAVAVAKASGDSGFDFRGVLKPILLNLAIIALGCGFGFLLKILMPQRRTVDNKLIIGIGTLFAFCGICALLGQSPLLGCMAMAMVYINISNDEKFFKQLAYFSPPLLLLFFVRSGATFNLSALTSASSIGSVALIVIAVLYFVIRIVGKYVGAYLGSLVVKEKKEIRRYLGLALIPQAGVAIGLAALGAREIGGDLGDALNTIILASSVLYELIGPPSAKLALYLSHSYTNNIDELVDVEAVNPDGSMKTEVDILIERINEIKKDVVHEEVSEEEKAFNEAAYEQYQNMYGPKTKYGQRRNK